MTKSQKTHLAIVDTDKHIAPETKVSPAGSATQSIFNFENTEIRTEVDSETGEAWFNAKDVCDALEHSNARKAILDHVDSVDVTKRYAHRKDSTGRIQRKEENFVNESGMYALIFGSKKPEAKQFKRFMTSVVIPTLRKTGIYSLAPQPKLVLLSDLMLQIPREWEKTFPDEFFKLSVEMITGNEFDRSRGTPSCIGGFINKYVYNFLDADIVRIAKQMRDSNGCYAYIHQFLDAKFGSEALKNHISTVINMMKASSQDYDIFKTLMNALLQSKSQKNMLLK